MFTELIIPNNKDFIIIEQNTFIKYFLVRKLSVSVYGRITHFFCNNEIKEIHCKWFTSIRNDKCLSLFSHKYNHNGNYELNYYKGKEYKFFKYTEVPLDYKGEALLPVTFDSHYLTEYPNLEIIELCNRPVTDKDGRVTFSRLLVNFR